MFKQNNQNFEALQLKAEWLRFILIKLNNTICNDKSVSKSSETLLMMKANFERMFRMGEFKRLAKNRVAVESDFELLNTDVFYLKRFLLQLFSVALKDDAVHFESETFKDAMFFNRLINKGEF